MDMIRKIVFTCCVFLSLNLFAQIPPSEDMRLYDIAAATSAQRIGQDVAKLVSFGTRHSLSDTQSETQGIGAARRWIKAEFEAISKRCGGCLEVIYIADPMKSSV